MSKVVYEGWMVRYGRRKIGRSYIHMRYFVLEPRLLAYYKKKPQDNQLPIKTMVIDGNCRVEDRGLKTHHGHMVYVLSIYNKKEKHHRITMAAFNIQEALMWKEKIECVIDQHQDSLVPSGQQYVSFEYKPGMDAGRTASSSDHESPFSALEDENDSQRDLLRRTTIGNGPPESILDWTKEFDAELSNQSSSNQAFSRKHWRLLQCQNGLRIFEELLEVDYLPRSCSRAMKAVGVVEATCEEIFELVMSMDGTRYEWDCSFHNGRLVEEVDGHTAILYHRLLLDWFPMVVWPRDLCYVRYWRRNDDGSYVVLFRSREHENCGPQPGFVRAHLESGGFNIAPLKPRNGRPRTQVQHLIQIDLKGWGSGYLPAFQQHCLLQMLNSVSGLREWFSQTDDRGQPIRIPVMVNMASSSLALGKGGKHHHKSSLSIDQTNGASRNSVLMDEDSDDDDEFQIPDSEPEPETSKQDQETDAKKTEEPALNIDLSCFSGNLRHDDNENARNCWRISDGNNFKVRGKSFCDDKRKIPAGKHLMDLVAVDWFKDTKRMDHVVRRKGCAAQVAAEKGLFSTVVNVQVPGSTHYSMVFYFVTKELVPGSLFQRFVDGDDEFRNSRLKLIPLVPKGSWIVRQSVGSTPCLLGKAVDCNYIRGPTYLEIDVDIGSSTVANGVLGLVIGVITSLVVEMAFLVQANTPEELPERLIGAVRVSHVELSSAIVPNLDSD
ncbi:Pleckstrin homology (PH) domain-containing protein / lipid-binding START domain-containing protein [Arabidopsis thaliana]|uniref:Protein ENHANCED DISEASE RESISTANCE 2-like n=2 Tax=Arabidopsis thaliana TaxID=3702 RepID=EDR2L_ARATH|nr:Pleckstrin homology (PH) domain-containing protein / lipid-binding START domain-containing protein [Arabidopsis thaliana]Q8VZF6.1 RecName: Full=Protein ENHANCED DISEASE RESISTANCE 2-like [Arabidopsis thaliana]AAL57642.1 AT5g45560/MFC19_23 [Arabidopsis thaliana]AED95268.1 Pleckstrin homology (PH) domain-containing protein / lipid-binding START domain-containing protein [Arabidopsis thaliana]|eukprot:NP_199369.2 Pleckstrin homology (PH) domain-containing protein / lipid-binding START domain-containing protein [Arabidopsis thaliana]